MSCPFDSQLKPEKSEQEKAFEASATGSLADVFCRSDPAGVADGGGPALALARSADELVH